LTGSNQSFDASDPRYIKHFFNNIFFWEFLLINIAVYNIKSKGRESGASVEGA
jgi:hypothetical protein